VLWGVRKQAGDREFQAFVVGRWPRLMRTLEPVFEADCAPRGAAWPDPV